MTNSNITSVKPSMPSTDDSSMSYGARALRRLFRAYQVARAGQLSPCRFVPSCSSYAIEAVEIHGAWRGSYYAARRLLRCHPFGAHGVDLVPAPRKSRI
jgi:hypothetical protein